MKTIVALAIALNAATFAPAITVDTVGVGDLGNSNDPATGDLYGGVGYFYRIGKYEVTIAQYTAFLNAVAATDTYGLYDTNMTYPDVAGIQRSGVAGSYTYTAIGSPIRPVTNVGWGDAARFANWLHNGQPIGAQSASTTEDGAYTLNGAVTAAALLAVVRNVNATWFIPTENEWYKAAYYQPASNGGDPDGYWNYPMRTNSMPYSDAPPGTTPDNTRVANFNFDDGINNGYNYGVPVGSPGSNRLTDVGAYTSSPSYYGTLDQGGNVYEWNESILLEPGTTSILARGQRGSSFQGTASAMAASFRGVSSTAFGSIFGGFRVATILPEPTTALLLLSAVGPLCSRRNGRWILTAPRSCRATSTSCSGYPTWPRSVGSISSSTATNGSNDPSLANSGSRT
jgi:sulfatase modifying factor 1